MYYSNGPQQTSHIMQFQGNQQQYAAMLPRHAQQHQHQQPQQQIQQQQQQQQRQPFLDMQQRQVFPTHVTQNAHSVPMRIAQMNQGTINGPVGYPYLQGGYKPLSSYVPHRHQTEPVPSEDVRYRKQLIVNYLAPNVSTSELHDVFSRIGPLDGARIIYNRQTGLPKGYGFVYFCNPEDAKQAVDTMNGVQFHGKRLKVGYSTNPLNIVSSAPTQYTNDSVV